MDFDLVLPFSLKHLFKTSFLSSLKLTTSNIDLFTSRLLESVPESPESVADGWYGGEQAQLDQFYTPSFLAILRDPAGDPHRAGRLGGVWQERSCIAFSQTLYGPRGFPRDWVSKQRAFEHYRFSSFLEAHRIFSISMLIRSSVVYHLLPQGHEVRKTC